MRIVCIFLPAFFAANYELKGNEDWFKKLVVYSKYCIFINFVLLIGLLLIGRGKVHFEDMCTVYYYILYIVLACLLSFIVPRLFKYISDNFNINIKRNNK